MPSITTEDRWAPVPEASFRAASVGIAVFVLGIFAIGGSFVPILDHANLVFHEAGHVVFGILGETPGLYGGTLGQLVIPAIVAFDRLTRRDAVGFALAGVWFFQNFLYVGWYMADARDHEIPLVGGGEHDFTLIFYRWRVLAYEKEIASVVTALGWLGMLGSWGWLAKRRRSS